MKFLFILSVASYVQYTLACNGYSLKIVKYDNCVDDPIIKLPEKDFDVILDKDCNVYAVGCIEITKGFTSAKGKYKAKKAPLPEIEGELDICQISKMLKKIPDLAKMLEVMGIPTKCPVQATKVCGTPENKISIGKYKNQIGMAAGNAEVRIEIEHDTGKSCIEIQTNISKPRKG